MIALYNFIPLYCPSCGTPTQLERVDNTNLLPSDVCNFIVDHQALGVGAG